MQAPATVALATAATEVIHRGASLVHYAPRMGFSLPHESVTIVPMSLGSLRPASSRSIMH